MTDISKAFESALEEQKYQLNLQDKVGEYKSIIVGMLKIMPKKKQRRISPLYWQFVANPTRENLRILQDELENINMGL